MDSRKRGIIKALGIFGAGLICGLAVMLAVIWGTKPADTEPGAAPGSASGITDIVARPGGDENINGNIQSGGSGEGVQDNRMPGDDGVDIQGEGEPGGQAGSLTDSSGEKPEYRNVLYYGEWSIYGGQKNFYPDRIDGSQITHLNFAFLDMDADGNLVMCDEHADFQAVLPEQEGLSYGGPYAGVLGAMRLLRSKYPNMKIGISVGGWTRSGDFAEVAADAAKRRNFAKNITKFVSYLGFDFVDIDWEYPTAVRAGDPEANGVSIDEGCRGSEADTHNFTLLMADIRSELDAIGAEDGKYYELSAAMSASPAMMEKIEYDKVLDIVDFLNMMTYDLNGAWNGYTGHQTALYTNPSYDSASQPDGQYSADTCISFLEEVYGSSIDYSKLVIGVAPYTRGWAQVQDDGPDKENPGLYATAAQNSVRSADGTLSGTYAYSDLEMLKAQYKLKEYYDETAEAAYYYSAETGYFFTCDNERSAAAKGRYVKEKKLGGLISWMASHDSENKILRAMKQSLYGEEELPARETADVVPQVSVTVSADGSDYTITLTNNEKAVETNAALKNAELFKKTVMNPKLYIRTGSGVLFSGGMESGSVTNEDGCGVIDLSPVYNAKAVKPGASHTFTVRAAGAADIEDIVEITLTQRILVSQGEFGKQVVYKGNGDGERGGTAGEAAGGGADSGVSAGKETDKESDGGAASEGETAGDGRSPDASENNNIADGELPKHMVTGYWHNFINGSSNLRLSDVPSYYDMICVAFTGSTSTPGEVTFNLDADLCRALGGYTKAQFIEDIRKLKQKGQHVIISVGGAEGRIEIGSDEAAALFAEGLTKIIEEYGFEGVDIDLEGSAVSGTGYIAGALRSLHDHFGEGFIITMAPETYYIQADRISSKDITTSYLRLALEIKDILTVCYPQFYNSGSMNGYGGTVVSPGSADFLASMASLVIEAGLSPDQVALGVPSAQAAAGSGYVSAEIVKTALRALAEGSSSGGFTVPKAYPSIRGVMTWSINWDATNNYAWAKAMSAAMDELDKTATVSGSKSGDVEADGKEDEVKTESGSTDGRNETGDGADSDDGQGSGTGGIPEWSPTEIYTGGDKVSCNGKIYRASWWTQGDNPETQGEWGPWKPVG